MRAITKDNRVEIAATFLGAFILGASFAKDFFMHGKFEVRVFFLGVSCFVLFLVIAVIAAIRIRVASTTYLILVFYLLQIKAQDFGNPSTWITENNAVLIQSGFPLYLEAQREFSTKDLEQGQNLTFHL